MVTETRKCQLSESRQRLIELMQEINFGWIEGLTLRGGEPMFKPAPRVIRDYKFGGENGSRMERDTDDFTLKMKVADLFRQFEVMGNGTIKEIEVKYGLPFRMRLDHTIQV